MLLLWSLLALTGVEASGDVVCRIAGDDAVVRGVEVATPSGPFVFDVRGLDVVAEPTATPAVARVQSTDSILFEGRAKRVTYRPRIVLQLAAGAVHLGSQAQLFASRRHGRHVRGPVRIGFEATIGELTVPCADLVLDLQDRRPATLPVQQRVYGARSWRATDRRYPLTSLPGTPMRFTGRRDLVTFAVVGRGPSKAHVVAQWADGGRLEAMLARDQLRLGPFGGHALSGGLQHALSGGACDRGAAGRRGGPNLYVGAASLPEGTALLTADGHEWGHVGTEVTVTLDWDRTHPRARVIDLPGITAPGHCTRCGIAWVNADAARLPDP